MKLYTEEQVKEMLNKINSVLPKRASLLIYMIENITEYMTPIELPSDEEIEKAANTQSHYEGAMWFKYKILKPNYKNEEN